MALNDPLVIGTRGSPLALAQAYETRERLCAAHGWAEDQVELVPVVMATPEKCF